MIAFHEADAAPGFLVPAPGQETVVQSIIIARQPDPEIENVAQKNHIAGAVLQNRQHLEKGPGIALGLTDVGIRNEHQLASRHGGRHHAGALRRLALSPTPGFITDSLPPNPGFLPFPST